LGPFEAWDAIGVRQSVEKIKAEGRNVPASIQKMLDTGHESFYKKEKGTDYQYDLVNQKYIQIEKDPEIIILSELPANKEIERNDSASLWNIGDGVICLEFHAKMNAIDNDIIAMQNKMCELLEEGKYEAAVVANHAENFSVGANIFMILMAINNDQTASVEEMVKAFQDANMRMKYCPRPVVSAPAGMALGGGCEITMHGQKVVGAAESYIGLVELGVGLIPSGGGTKEMVLRMAEGIRGGAKPALLQFAQKAFENIAMAKVSIGFKEAQDLGIIRTTDIMVTNRDLLIHTAKEVALGMAKEGFNPGKPKTDIPVAGESAYAAFIVALEGMKNAGYISEYDKYIASKLGYVIAGGKRAEWQTISEQELLDLEREVFMHLLGQEKTKDRISYMLMNNKPLRN